MKKKLQGLRPFIRTWSTSRTSNAFWQITNTLEIEDWHKTPPNQSTYYFICILVLGYVKHPNLGTQSDSVVVLWVNTSLTTQESKQARGHTHVYYNYGVLRYID